MIFTICALLLMLISRAFVTKSELSEPSFWVVCLAGALVRCGLAAASHAPYGSSTC